MKAALALFHGIFDALFSIPLMDTGVTFGHFVMALIVFDVCLIVLRHVFRKDGGSSGGGKPPANGGVKS